MRRLLEAPCTPADLAVGGLDDDDALVLARRMLREGRPRRRARHVTALPCSDGSRLRDEPLAATASRVDRWLLVEHTGPWGPETVPSGRMDLRVSRRLGELASEARARLLLLRRHGGVPTDGGRWVYAVDSRPGSEQVWGRLVRDDEELLALQPFTDVAGWHRVDTPLYLVCTHGRHDRCCAVRGRPVAHALGHDDRNVWECSHIGGDRFAANLLVLPEGLYFGRVEPEEARALALALESGDLGRAGAARLRGRSSLTLPAQAAQQFAREQLDRTALDDLAPVAQETLQPDVWRVRLGGSGGPDVEVVVRYVRGGEPAVLTCGGDPKVAPTFACDSLRVDDGAPVG